MVVEQNHVESEHETRVPHAVKQYHVEHEQ